MFDDNLFTEITDDEMNRYLADIADESEEYKEISRKNKLILKTNLLSKYIDRLNSANNRLTKEFETYREHDSADCIESMLNISKNIFANLYDLFKEVDLHYDHKEPFLENGLIMHSKDITIEEGNSFYKITLPCLIPHKKMAQTIPDYANSYRIPVYNALKKHFPAKRPLFNDKACIIFVHYFEEGQALIDYDNFDYTHIINCLASFFLRDDNPNYYSLHITSKQGYKSHTEILVANEMLFDIVWRDVTFTVR